MALIAAVPQSLLVRLGNRAEPVPPIRDERIKSIALAAVETAKAAGADYADVRLTHSRTPTNFLWGNEEITIGVRALYGGYWGFASSPLWSVEEARRLAQAATNEARYNVSRRRRPIELAPVPVINDGHWETPIEIDPFRISSNEINDFLRGLASYIRNTVPDADPMVGWSFSSQAKAFASTEGSYCTQRLDTTYVSVGMEYKASNAGFEFPMGEQARAGWEYVFSQEAAIRSDVKRWIEVIEEEISLPEKVLDPGRYDTVFDAYSVASFIGPTIGIATELDRAMGYEANAGGTSYLNDPLEMLGKYQIGTKDLTVTGNRSTLTALGTFKWDDDGAEPTDGALVKDGVLSDYITNRESASWIKSYYEANNMPFESRGSSLAMNGLHAPLTQIPNLVMKPSAGDADFDSLIGDMEKGIAVRFGGAGMDFQQRTGTGGGIFYEVRNGRRVARVRGLSFLFRAPEPWKDVVAIGGASSARWSARTNYKGEPKQPAEYSISSVPMAVRDFIFIDPTRRG